MTIGFNATFLIVDDQLTSTALTRATLGQLGYSAIDTVTSTADALDRLRTRRYDIVISDWHMPPDDGPELLRWLKRAATVRAPKFYFLTMDDRWGNMVTARELGAAGFIAKPARPFQLMSRLSQALAGA